MVRAIERGFIFGAVLAAYLAATVAATNAQVCGDLDGSGDVTTGDALLALAEAVGLNPPLACPTQLEGGAIFVTVSGEFSGRIAGATVLTNPRTESLETDAIGTALMTEVAPGLYQIYATHPQYGTAIGAVLVEAGQLSTLELPLVSGVFLGPMVMIESPSSLVAYDADEPIVFLANVSDAEDAAEDLELIWESSIDGVLSTDPADETGNTQFLLEPPISIGQHEISLTAIDTDGFSTVDTVTIFVEDLPEAVVLDPLTKDAASITLTWMPVDEPGFQSYRIYRSTNPSGGFAVIGVLDDPLADTFVDTDLTLDQTYYYRVGLLADGGESSSNVEGITAGVGIDIGVRVDKLLADPTRPFLYAIDSVNNSLLFVNLETNTVEKTIFVGSRPADMDADPSYSELFIANFGSSQLAVVDLETQEIARTMIVDTNTGVWDGNPYRIEYMDGDRLVFTSEDQWCDLKLVSSATGVNQQSTGSLYQPDLEASPDGTRLYVGESGSSGSELIRFDLINGSLQQVDISGRASGFGSRSVVMSGDGEFVFYGGRKFTADNLQGNLGQFSEVIYATNFDGSLAVGRDSIYDAETFATLMNLPIQTSVMTISPDDSTLYLHSPTTGRIFLFNLEGL